MRIHLLSSLALAAALTLLGLSASAQTAAPNAVPAAPAVATKAAPVSAAPAAVAPATTTPAATAPTATANAAPAAPASATPASASLDARVQDLKSDVIKLNRDLLVLEEELLFPANTQVALFVSMDVGKLFELDSVQIKLDDKLVTNYLYTPAEVQALHRGGVQRAFVGNLKSGAHEIVAVFTGKGPHERDYKRGTTIKFDKGSDPKVIELRIKDSTGKLQPEFDVKIW
jgi:hypothetical protein